MAARILIIEDNPANLELVRYLLNAAGYATLHAQDGAEGLALARAERPDLVITDLQMPEFDGYEVLRSLRADPAQSGTVIVAVTAFSMVRDREEVMTAGFDGYISKPIEPETFLQSLEALMRPGMRAAAPARGS